MHIRPPIKQTGKWATVYGVGNLLSKLIVFLLIPVYTRFLSATEVGILALLEMMEMFLFTVIPLGINSALWRHLPETSGEDHKRKLIMSAFTGTILSSLIILGMVVTVYRSLAVFLGLQQDDSWLILVITLNVFLGMGSRFILALWQYQGQPGRYVLLSLMQFFGVLVVTILFVVDFGWGLRGVVVARSVVYSVLFVVSTFLIIVPNLSVPSFSSYKILVGFGAPLVLLALVTPILTFSDRFFMRLFVSLEDIGVYSIAYKFGMLINMVLVVPLQRSWGPMMYHLGVGNESHEFHRDMLFYYAITGATIFLVVSIFSRELLTIATTEAYLSGAFIIPIVTLAYFVNGFGQFFMAGAALSDKTPRLAFAALAGIAVNLLVSYFLIQYFGVPGAAWSTVISYLFLVYLVYLSSQSLVPIDWKCTRVGGVVVIMGVVYGLALLMRWWLPSWAVLWGIVATGIFPVILWSTGIIGPRELRGFKSLLVMLKGGKERI